MQQIKSALSFDANIFKNLTTALTDYPLETVCFFDIETTGLSADISSLYLIGCACFEKDSLQLTQWFADDYVSEKELLIQFSSYISNFRYLFHYNGSGFDIPYLTKKYVKHCLPNPFETLESVDLYKLLRPYKSLFPLANLKLTTLENLLRIKRSDCFSGKDCIEIYVNFMKNKYYENPETKENCRQKLLLHNHDDIVGTVLCSQLLLYLAPLTGANVTYSITETDAHLVCHFLMDGSYPKAFSYETAMYSVSFHDSICEIIIPLYYGTYFYFFPDVKNYYYLPEEDIAIHKCVAMYTDASHRQKATAKNCYTKKEGTFLSLPSYKKSKNLSPEVPFFFTKDKTACFIEWTGELPVWYISEYLLSAKANFPK